MNTYTRGRQRNPSVAALKDGGFVIAWDSNHQDGSSYGVYAQRYNARGRAVGIEFRVNTATVNSQSHPAVAALADGGFIVAWGGQTTELYFTSYPTNVYGQRFSAAGSRVGTEFRINTDTTPANLLHDDPSVAGLSGGGFIVTWTSQGQDGSFEGVYGQRYDARGVPVGGEFQVNTDTIGDQNVSSVAALNDGGFIVTWQSRDQYNPNLETTSGIFAQRYRARGTKVGGEFRVNTNTIGNQIGPSVAGLSNGGFVVTWQSWGEPNQGTSGVGIFGQQFGP